jgi:hypothetical protein
MSVAGLAVSVKLDIFFWREEREDAADDDEEGGRV